MQRLGTFYAVIVLGGALLVGAPPVYAAEPAARPDGLSADGGRYYGPLVNGRFHGRGRLVWDNGDVYEGDFVDGRMSGKGRRTRANGDVYEGEFRAGRANGKGRLQDAQGATYVGEFRDDEFSGKGRYEAPGDFNYEGDFLFGEFDGQGEYREANHHYKGGFRRGRYSGHGEGTYPDGSTYRGNHVKGRWEGKGRFENTAKEVYEGDFRGNEFTGKGTYTSPAGIRYEGGFAKWRFEGQGKYFLPDGSFYEGRFVNGSLQGRGSFSSKDGTRYIGNFKDWLYEGAGELRMSNGDVYKGQFQNGMFHGRGTYTYAQPRDGKKQASGIWQRGRLQEHAAAMPGGASLGLEAALYSQRKLLDEALAAIAPDDPGKIDMYVLTVAGDGSQEVFRREVEYVRKQFAERFGTGSRSVSLVNSRSTFTTVPMATVTSIGEAVKAIAGRMDKEKDILFLYLTSHGSPDVGFYLNQEHMDLRGLSARDLAGILKESGIRWKVVVVSACYSGGFLSPLRDDTTLIITAARADRRSFGCADENDFTYFGEAYFRDALPQSTSFAEAFEKAKAIVEKREATHQVNGEKMKEEDFSRPQMHNPDKVDAYLRTWWTQVSR